MLIQPATLQEINIIYSLAQRIWEPTYKNILSREQLDYMFVMMYSPEALSEQMSDKRHNFILIHDDNEEYIGFASFEFDYAPGTTKIHKLYVLPETQGKGAGKMLVDYIAGAAGAKGNNRIVLNVNRFNPAYRFYLKAGFTTEREEDIEIGNGYLMEDYVMVKHF